MYFRQEQQDIARLSETISIYFQTVCDPDLDIGVTVSKKTKEPKNDVRLQPGSCSEPTLIPPDLKAMANSSDWVWISLSI